MNTFPEAQPGDPEETEDANQLLAVQEAGYVEPDVETDQAAIEAQVYSNLSERVSGWQPHDGNLDTWLIEDFSEVGAELRSLIVDVPASVFGTYGTRVLGLPPYPATAATGTATFTAQDPAGYTLDTGTVFGLPRSGNDIAAFATLQEASIPPGEQTVADVPFAAVVLGAAGNGLLGEGVMLDPVSWVATVAVPTPTARGQDAETPEAYVDRLGDLFPSVALRPILPIDFAVLAMKLIPGVGRAVAMNLYDPATGTWNNERTVTLVVAQADGTPVGVTVQEQVQTLLEGLREINFVVNVMDAEYVTVPATFNVIAYAGQNEQTVHDACVANLTNYLRPANYRLGELSPATAGGEVINPPVAGHPTRRQTIYVNDVIAMLDRTLGVDHVVSVTLAGAAVDYELPNAYTLPEPGTVTGEVQGGAA